MVDRTSKKERERNVDIRIFVLYSRVALRLLFCLPACVPSFFFQRGPVLALQLLFEREAKLYRIGLLVIWQFRLILSKTEATSLPYFSVEEHRQSVIRWACFRWLTSPMAKVRIPPRCCFCATANSSHEQSSGADRRLMSNPIQARGRLIGGVEGRYRGKQRLTAATGHRPG